MFYMWTRIPWFPLRILYQANLVKEDVCASSWKLFCARKPGSSTYLKIKKYKSVWYVAWSSKMYINNKQKDELGFIKQIRNRQILKTIIHFLKILATFQPCMYTYKYVCIYHGNI